MNATTATIAAVGHLLPRARSLLFITGAGISADSGLPTYRGVSGLYSDATTSEGYAIEDALSAAMFARQPAITWKYLWQIGAACSGAKPNAAHRWLVDLAQQRDVWILTQNVDGLHRQAALGYTRQPHLIEAHGHAFDLYCTVCRARYTAAQQIADYRGDLPPLPRCGCGGLLRPDVVLFGEMLPAAVTRGFNRLQQQSFDLVFSIGTSAQFPYISYFITQAAAQGVPTVEINPAETDVSDWCSHVIRMPAAAACNALAAYVVH